MGIGINLDKKWGPSPYTLPIPMVASQKVGVKPNGLIDVYAYASESSLDFYYAYFMHTLLIFSKI